MPGQQGGSLQAVATMLTGGSSSSSSSSPPAPACPSSSASPPRGTPATALLAAPGSSAGSGKGSRRLVCARQKAGLRPRPPAQRPERRAPGPRSARLQASSRPTSNQSSSAPAPGGLAAGVPSSRRPSIPEEPPPGLPEGGALPPIQDERAKTPCYEVSEEELERLLLAGALAGRPLESGDVGEEEDDRVYEISEEDFERLLRAGQLHLAAREDQAAAAAAEHHLIFGRFKPPPSTAPAELPRRVPTASLQARPRVRPQTVDCGHETKMKSPPSSAAASALASVPPAAGSPLHSARLLRGLRAGLSQQHQPAGSSSRARAALWRQEKREQGVSKSKCSAEGDDTAEEPSERPLTAGTTLGDSPALGEFGCEGEGSRFLASPSPEESLADDA